MIVSYNISRGLDYDSQKHIYIQHAYNVVRDARHGLRGFASKHIT